MCVQLDVTTVKNSVSRHASVQRRGVVSTVLIINWLTVSVLKLPSVRTVKIPIVRQIEPVQYTEKEMRFLQANVWSLKYIKASFRTHDVDSSITGTTTTGSMERCQSERLSASNH